MRALLVAAAALWLGPQALAIDPHRTMSQYVRERFGVERGFPRGAVYAIQQTQDGYLWIGTEGGLVRFDGLRFSTMRSAGSVQPSLSHVLGLLADGDGTLWVRLRRPGLTLLAYRGGAFGDGLGDLGTHASLARMGRADDGSPLFCMVEGPSSSIVIRNRKSEVVAAPANFARSAVLSMTQTANGDIWVGTSDAGLFRIRQGEVVAVTEGLPDLKVNALVPFGDNKLWVGTDAGVVRWNGSKLDRTGIPRELDKIQALAMIADRDRNLWIGTNSNGLLRLNVSGVAFLEPSANAGVGAITTLLEDREGAIWFGSANVIERLRDSPFITYSQSEGIPSDGSKPLFVDSEQRTWYAPVAGGVQWFRNGKHGRVTADGIDKDVVYSIAGGGNEVWVGRQRGGLTRLTIDHDSVRATTYTQADGLAQNSVYAVHRARDGTVWAGTLSGGVSRLVNGHFTTYTVKDGLASNSISAILEGSNGTMWFATPGGVSSFVNGKWQTFSTGLASLDVTSLLEDSAGVLWVGTSSGPAFRVGQGFQVPAGIPPSLRDQVLGMEQDRGGALWIATASHVLRVNRNPLFEGKLGDGDIREYGLADGLRGLEGVRRHRSVVSDLGGNIWFSLNLGISVVDPERLRVNAAPAIPQIESVSADEAGLPIVPNLQIFGGPHRVTFGFAGLSLSVPERVRFRYRLDPFDSDWSGAVTSRETVYTNLSPGNYRFRVIASNADGIWSRDEAGISIRVEPLLWQAWWFRTGGALVLIGIVWAMYQRRLGRVTRGLNMRFEERLAERTRIAQELHDTLLQGFLSASMQVHVAADKLPPDSPLRRAFDRPLELIRQVIDEGRHAVRGLRSTKTESLDLETAFSQIQNELAPNGSGTDTKFRVTVNGAPRPLHPLLRDELYRIGREAVINAFRHARARSVDVEMCYLARQFALRVRDDGRGIDELVLKSGKDGHYGLSGMRERSDRIGGRLHIWSGASGTEVEIVIPSRLAFTDYRGALAWLRWPRRAREVRCGLPTKEAEQ